MPTRAERAHALTEQENQHRHARAAARAKAEPTKAERHSAAQHASKKGRSVHGRTKLQADAKAGKPNVGLDGGEPRSGGAPVSARKSRKSTRRSLPAGEKPNAETRTVRARMATPEARAARGK